jgi:hypothetical protein
LNLHLQRRRAHAPVPAEGIPIGLPEIMEAARAKKNAAEIRKLAAESWNLSGDSSNRKYLVQAHFLSKTQKVKTIETLVCFSWE